MRGSRFVSGLWIRWLLLLTLPASTYCAGAGFSLFVSNERSDDVTVVDGTTLRVERTFHVGKRPRGIHVGPVTGHLYVALSGSPRMGPGADAERAKHLVPDRAADGIAIINPDTGATERTLRVGSDPEQFALDRDEKRLVVSNEDDARASVWDIASGARVAALPVGEEPEGITIAQTRNEVYVTCEGTGDVYIFSLADFRELARLHVGGRPRSVSFTPDESRAFVCAEGLTTVAVLDAATHRVLRTIPITGGPVLPMMSVVTLDARQLLVSTGRGDSLAVLDLSADHTAALIPVGGRPWGVALSPDGRTAFTANGTTNDVSVIDVASGRETARLKVGAGPWGIAVAAQRD